jgi:hypothetical protein
MRAFAHCQRQTFPSSAEGQRALIRWLRKHKVGKAAMEASGGYERDWAKALREVGIEALSPEPLLNGKAIYGRPLFDSIGPHAKSGDVRFPPAIGSTVEIGCAVIYRYAPWSAGCESRYFPAARPSAGKLVNSACSVISVE